MITRRLIILSRLGSIVTSKGEEIIGPGFLIDGDVHTKVTRYLIRRGECQCVIGIDRQHRVYLTGGFTDYDMKTQTWKANGRYHHYDSPKFIGHLQEII